MRKGQRTLELAAEAATQAKTAQTELWRLQRQLKRQRAVTQALWRLVRDKLGLADDELIRLAAEIEAAEKEQPAVADLCPECGRSLQENQPRCIYCGAPAVRRKIL